MESEVLGSILTGGNIFYLMQILTLLPMLCVCEKLLIQKAMVQHFLKPTEFLHLKFKITDESHVKFLGWKLADALIFKSVILVVSRP